MTGHFETLRADVGALRDEVGEFKRLENIRPLSAIGAGALRRWQVEDGCKPSKTPELARRGCEGYDPRSIDAFPVPAESEEPFPPHRCDAATSAARPDQILPRRTRGQAMVDFVPRLADGADVRAARRAVADRILVLDGAMGTEIRT
jgi:hypothetical protein